MVYRHAGHLAPDQFGHLGIHEVDAGQAYAVQLSAAAVFKPGQDLISDSLVDEGHIITARLRRDLKSVQHGSKKRMRQPLLALIHKENTQTVRLRRLFAGRILNRIVDDCC